MKQVITEYSDEVIEILETLGYQYIAVGMLTQDEVMEVCHMIITVAYTIDMSPMRAALIIFGHSAELIYYKSKFRGNETIH